MNEKRFIELVNLYIDHEISPPELKELENEVAHNAQRRRIYHDYCRLQMASQAACQEFGHSLVQSVDFRKYQILARESESRSRIGILYSAGALAAACLAVFAAISVFTSQKITAGEAAEFAEADSEAVVEIFRPSQTETRVARVPVRTPVSGAMANAREFASYRAVRAADLAAPVRASARGGFQFSVFPATTSWTEDYRSGSSSRVFRSSSSFEAPELGPVQFQR